MGHIQRVAPTQLVTAGHSGWSHRPSRKLWLQLPSNFVMGAFPWSLDPTSFPILIACLVTSLESNPRCSQAGALD